MNQILFENIESRPSNIKSTIRFFGISIIVFGIALVAIGAFAIVQWVQSQAPVSTNKPVISANVTEDGRYIKLAITHDKAIEKIVFSWSNGVEKTELGRNRKEFEIMEEIQMGENTLNVRVIDTIGVETGYTNTYVYSNGVDIQKPTIELSSIEASTQVHIIAMDETEISYITYRWNDEEETKIETTDESKSIIETTIDIPEGENTLTVVAVDANNNMETKEQKCAVYTKPIIEKPRQNGNKLTIKVTDNQGIEYLEYILNGKKYTATNKNGKIIKEFNFDIPLQPGENTIIINARNIAGVEATTFKGKCISR